MEIEPHIRAWIRTGCRGQDGPAWPSPADLATHLGCGVQALRQSLGEDLWGVVLAGWQQHHPAEYQAWAQSSADAVAEAGSYYVDSADGVKKTIDPLTELRLTYGSLWQSSSTSDIAAVIRATVDLDTIDFNYIISELLAIMEVTDSAGKMEALTVLRRTIKDREQVAIYREQMGYRYGDKDAVYHIEECDPLETKEDIVPLPELPSPEPGSDR